MEIDTAMIRRSQRNLVALTLAITIGIGLCFAAPLFRHGARGIGYSYHADPGGPLTMVAGDHLQLMYHFWLQSDALWGDTPFFRNPYEFNTGRHSEGPALGGAYYAPFGQFFALLEPWLGQPAAWNLTAFASLWLGYLAMVLLLRRYLGGALWPALLGAMPVLMLPYRWISLLGGSPTGFAMMWPPVIMLGVDLAVRDRRLSGAWLAGAALVLSKWSDTHVFFFGFLATPFWALFALAWSVLHDDAPREPAASRLTSAAGRIMHLWPLAICMGVALVSTLVVTRSLDDSLMETGRGLGEVLLFSPRHQGLLGGPGLGGLEAHVYVGRALTVVLLAGLAALLADALRRREGAARRLTLYVVLLAAAATIAFLALGPRNPLDYRLLVLRGMRRLIPPYRMIRQTSKLFSILPPLLSLLFGLALARIARLRLPKAAPALLAGALCLWTLADFAARIRPGVCLLDNAQGAYAAIAEDARGSGEPPRAMAIVLWPGDSHWSSLYQYYASLYRIRMLNGYSPVVGRAYFEDIFQYFSPMNTGHLDDERLDRLLDRGIRYLLLHEDAFPEKVSPFPVQHTLRALIRHPRLRFLARDRAVWSFRIEAEHGPLVPEDEAGFVFPARSWEAEHHGGEGHAVLLAPGDASGDRHLRLPPDSGPFATPPQPVGHSPGLRYFIRGRGPGVADAEVIVAGTPGERTTVQFPDDWAWIEIGIPAFDGYHPVRLAVTATDSPLDVDVVLLGAGPWPQPERPGDAVRWPAAAFFRAGHSDPETGFVTLEARRVPTDYVFYGPNHMWPAGRYEIEVDFDSTAPAHTVLGTIGFRAPPEARDLLTALTAGQACRFEYEHHNNRPLGLQLRFSRAGDLRLHAVTVRKLP